MTYVRALFVAIMVAVAALTFLAAPAHAVERGAKAWTIEGPDGEKYGCRHVGDGNVTQILCTPLNGPGAMQEYYTVVPSGSGGWAVLPLNGNEGTWEGADALSAILNTAPAMAMPPSPAVAGAPAIRAPTVARAGALCIVNYSVPVDADGTLYIEWGDGSETTHNVVAGQTLQLTHEYHSGFGSLFSELYAFGTRYVHQIDYRHEYNRHVWLGSTFLDHHMPYSTRSGGVEDSSG